jgi:hypothetical protein
MNYVCQTTFIPALAPHYRPAYEGLVDAFSITNPRSLAWAIEMWGYALLRLRASLLVLIFVLILMVLTPRRASA